MNLIFPVLAGFLAGIISGFGIGGGTILMIYLTLVMELPQRTAQGINLLYFLPTAAAALIIHSKNRFVQWKTVIPAAVSGCILAALAGYAAMNLDLALLKKLFGGFLILTGLLEFFKKSRK